MIEPPATRPELYSTPGPASDSASLPRFRSTIRRTSPPAYTGVVISSGRYIPTANASAGTPMISMRIEVNTPSRTRPHGSCWVRMPLVTRLMRVACGAGAFSDPIPSWIR